MRISVWSSDGCSSDLKSLVPVLNPDGSVALDHEEFPRPETTAEGLAALKPSFAALADFDMGDGFTFRKQINRRYPDLEIQHFHHAGNSSGVVDGDAAVLLTSKDYADRHGLKQRGRRSEAHASEIKSIMRRPYAV